MHVVKFGHVACRFGQHDWLATAETIKPSRLFGINAITRVTRGHVAQVCRRRDIIAIMPSASETSAAAVFAGGVALLVFYAYRKNALMQPTAEEQAWLNSQMATPRSPAKPNADEQAWLDKQMKDQEEAEMLDDARQAGAHRR